LTENLTQFLNERTPYVIDLFKKKEKT